MGAQARPALRSALAVAAAAAVAAGYAIIPPSHQAVGGTRCEADGQGANAHLRFESDPSELFMAYDAYVVRYDVSRRGPAFTAHVLRPEAIDARGRPRAVRRSGFRVVEVPGGGLSARDADYARSGYDRGHLVPAGDFVWDQAAKDETFSYANVAPFNPNLNRGAWAQLESTLRERVAESGEAAYVITGSLFSWDAGDIGPDRLALPTHFYKLAYFAESGDAFAFLFDNSVTAYAGSLDDYQTTVDFVESVAGEDFFDLLDDQCEGAMEAAKPGPLGTPTVDRR